MKPPLSDTLRTVDQSGSGRGAGPGRAGQTRQSCRSGRVLRNRWSSGRLAHGFVAVAEPVHKLLGKGVRVRQRGRQAAHALVREAGETPAKREHGAKGFAVDNLRV